MNEVNDEKVIMSETDYVAITILSKPIKEMNDGRHP